jgi:hypothetical protein
MLTNESIYFAAGAAAVLAVQSALAVILVRALRRVHGLDARVAHLSDALTLLTETTETGFRAVAGEVERLTQRPARRDSRAAAGRITKAARHGRTLQEIAAAERLSEGEVRLRLHMAETGTGPLRDGAAVPESVAVPGLSATHTRGARSQTHGALRA